MSTSSEKTPGQPSGGAVGWKTVSVFVSSTFDDKNQIPEAVARPDRRGCRPGREAESAWTSWDRCVAHVVGASFGIVAIVANRLACDRPCRYDGPSMKRCPACGKQHPEGTFFCPIYGATIEEEITEYAGFISYRRKAGGQTARLIKLMVEKYSDKKLFLDVDELDAGRFDEIAY